MMTFRLRIASDLSSSAVIPSANSLTETFLPCGNADSVTPSTTLSLEDCVARRIVNRSEGVCCSNFAGIAMVMPAAGYVAGFCMPDSTCPDAA